MLGWTPEPPVMCGQTVEEVKSSSSRIVLTPAEELTWSRVVAACSINHGNMDYCASQGDAAVVHLRIRKESE